MITTKTGDKGQTTCGNKRVDKDNMLIEVMGTIDELQAILGIVRSNPSKSPFDPPAGRAGKGDFIVRIQKDLMGISGELACGIKYKDLEKMIGDLEKELEAIEKKLPELKEFIIPGKNEIEAMIHFGRAVCRRVERRIVSLNKLTKVNPDVLKYFNRLSDYLFILSRTIE